MATQNESILALLRVTETKWVPKWPIESLFDSIVAFPWKKGDGFCKQQEHRNQTGGLEMAVEQFIIPFNRALVYT